MGNHPIKGAGLDLALLRHSLGRLRGPGTGAARQRAVYARTGELTDVIEDLARQTRG